MKLASHNSWSYQQPLHWWQRVFNPFSQCQCLSIEAQLAKGVQYFDLRVRMTGEMQPQVCHGLVDYECEDLYYTLSLIERQKGMVRIYLDTRHPSADEAEWFKDFCQRLLKAYPAIYWCGGHGAHKPNWREQYVYLYPEPVCTELYSSVCCKGVSKILPRRYARLNNARILDENKDRDTFIMIDFVEI